MSGPLFMARLRTPCLQHFSRWQLSIFRSIRISSASLASRLGPARAFSLTGTTMGAPAFPAADVTALSDIGSHFMQLALAAGNRALPACLPNPPVGCVLVRNAEAIATGSTQDPGKDHAEAMALTQVPGWLSDA